MMSSENLSLFILLVIIVAFVGLALLPVEIIVADENKFSEEDSLTTDNYLPAKEFSN